MKTGQPIVAAALAGALCLATSATLGAAEPWPFATMKPLMAASFDAGSKHVVSYFLNADGRCRLTIMVAERLGEDDRDPPAQALRLKTVIEPGRTARVDTEEGKSLRFACQVDALTMTVTPINRLAAADDAE